MAEQNFSNHVKFVPTYHFFVLPVFVLNFVQSIYGLIRPGFTWNGLVHFLTALALVVFAFNARIFALRVQDRVIRLEERLRFTQLLPDDLKPRSAVSTGKMRATQTRKPPAVSRTRASCFTPGGWATGCCGSAQTLPRSCDWRRAASIFAAGKSRAARIR